MSRRRPFPWSVRLNDTGLMLPGELIGRKIQSMANAIPNSQEYGSGESLHRTVRRLPGPPPGHGRGVAAQPRAEPLPRRPQRLDLRAVAGEGPPLPLADAPGRRGPRPGLRRREARGRAGGGGLRPLGAPRPPAGGRQRGGAGGVAGRGGGLRPRERRALLARRGRRRGQPVRGGAHGPDGRPGGAVALRRGHLDRGARPGPLPVPHRRPPDAGVGQPGQPVQRRPHGGRELDGRDRGGGRHRRHQRPGRGQRGAGGLLPAPGGCSPSTGTAPATTSSRACAGRPPWTTWTPRGAKRPPG